MLMLMKRDTIHLENKLKMLSLHKNSLENWNFPPELKLKAENKWN